MNSIDWYKSEYFLPISHRMTGCVSATIIQKVIYFMIFFYQTDTDRCESFDPVSQSVYLFFSPKRLIVFLSVQINTFWSHKTLLRVGSLEEIIETKRERREREREREEECVCMGACACVRECVSIKTLRIWDLWFRLDLRCQESQIKIQVAFPFKQILFPLKNFFWASFWFLTHPEHKPSPSSDL